MRWRRTPAATPPLNVSDDSWIEVGRLGDFTHNRMVVEVDGLLVLIVRCGNSVVAVQNECPHLARPLSDGRITKCVIQCAGHSYRWNLVSGKAVSGPVRRRRLRHVPLLLAGDRLLLVSRSGDA
jgi:toluene monooxygenase system ferredoxin subunit